MHKNCASTRNMTSSSTFGQKLESHTLSLPNPVALTGVQTRAPFVFFGDEAFPLRTNMMRPFPRKDLGQPEAVFNYRLSRVRRIIENSLGILAAR
jgi:hypothetical protein